MLKSKSEERNFSHILPNAVTFANMALGVIAIYISMDSSSNNIKTASVLILIAGAADKLDGYVARKLGATSKFGKELDSLCDLVSFGVAPVLVWWNISIESLDIAMALASLLYIGAGAFRLARFNISKDEQYIVGLPITIAGMVMVGKCLLDISYRLTFINNGVFYGENLVIAVLLSVMMVSNFKVKKPL
ncbi:MAG: CDP-diacylglycerol--serine O-phosphatidyltransferase [Thermoanaerobacteraceae bacterium]|nr:CDP-diacylglycerol--serine O-phosphatidyltransferase [Thermoanaerobacteraceae bacterium]